MAKCASSRSLARGSDTGPARPDNTPDRVLAYVTASARMILSWIPPVERGINTVYEGAMRAESARSRRRTRAGRAGMG
jgi:hypothetical protein